MEIQVLHNEPLPPHNGHLSATATFLCPQGGRCKVKPFLRGGGKGVLFRFFPFFL